MKTILLAVLSIAACGGASTMSPAAPGPDAGVAVVPDAAPIACRTAVPADGSAHLVAVYTLPPTPLHAVDPLLTTVDETTALANGAMTVTAPGIGSGLVYAGGCPETVYLVTDRGPNDDHATAGVVDGTFFPAPAFTPTVVKATLGTAGIAIVSVLPLLNQHDGPITGLPNDAGDGAAFPSPSATQTIATNPDGMDVEDLRRLPSGDFLVVEEQSPSLALIDGATGRVRVRYVPAGFALGADTDVHAILPAILRSRRPNHGFEGLALSADGAAAYAILQTPMGDDSDSTYAKSRIVRVIRLDVSDPANAAVTGDFLIQTSAVADYPSGNKQKDVKISSATWLGAERLLVLERADGEVKLRAFTLDATANVLGNSNEDTLDFEDVNAELGALGVTPAQGTLVLSTLEVPTLGNDKLEGLDVIDDDTVALSNDNDFGIKDPTEASQVWIVRTAAAFR